MAAKKVFQFKDAARSEQVLIGGHARDGGLVQFQFVGNFAQHQRTHRHLAVIEKVALPLDDGLRYPLNRLEALLHIFEQPFGFLQLVEQAAAAGSASGSRSAPAFTRQNVRIHAVDFEPWHRRRIDMHLPRAAGLAQNHVRGDIARVARAVLRAWARIQRQQQITRGLEHRIVAFAHAPQRSEVACCQKIQMRRCNFCRDGASDGGGNVAQLQAQALAQIACAHARRLA